MCLRGGLTSGYGATMGLGSVIPAMTRLPVVCSIAIACALCGNAAHAQPAASVRSIEELQALVRGGAKVGAVLEASALCDASLRQHVDAESISGNAIEVMFAIAKGVDPRLASMAPPGLLQGGGGGPVASDLLLERRVGLSGGRITIASALDQLVDRVGGVGWWVAERCEPAGPCACRLGLVTASSTVFSSYSISPPVDGAR